MPSKRAILPVALCLLVAAMAVGIPSPDAKEPREIDAGPPGNPLEHARGLVDDGRYAEAEALARQLLAEAESAEEADRVRMAETLDVLVEALARGGKTRASETLGLARRAVALKEDALGSEHPALADSLNNLAILRRIAGAYAEAQSLLERVVSIRRQALGPDHPTLATTLNDLAVVLRETSDYSASRELYEEALEIRQTTLGPEHPDVATTLHHLGILSRLRGDYTEAMRFFEQGLAIRESALDPNHPEVAESLNSIALVLGTLGEYEAARRRYERAISIWEEVLGPDHPDLAGGLNNFAILLRHAGKYSEAKKLYERALAIDEKALGPEHPYVALDLNNLAVLLDAMGDDVAARQSYERAIEIQRKALGPEHPDLATSLDNLGKLLTDWGEYDAAEPLFEEALAIYEESVGPEHPDVAFCLENFGNLRRATGDLAGARQLFERSRAVRAEILGPGHPLLAATLDNLGTLLMEGSARDEARPLLERVVEIRRETLGPDHPLLGASLSNLGRLYWEMNEPAMALAVALRAERIGRDHLRLTARSLAEREALRYAAARSSGLDVALSVASQAPDAGTSREAWDAVCRSRSIVLDEMATRHRAVRRTESPEIAPLSRAVSTARRRLARLFVRGPGSGPPEPYTALLEEAWKEAEHAERALAESSLAFRDELRRDRLGLDDIAVSLPPGSALLAYVRFERHERPASGQSGAPREPVSSYLAFVLRHGEELPAVVPLGPAEEIDRLVERWKQEAEARPSAVRAAARRTETRYRELGERLREAVWDPVQESIGDSHEVFVVPDGALHLLSLATLPVGDAEYLVDTSRLVHYLSTERELVPTETSGPTGRGFLAMGGSSYDATSLFASLRGAPRHEYEKEVKLTAVPFRGLRSSCGDFRTLRFEALPASKREVDEVAELWARAHSGEHREVPIAVLTGPAASEGAFKRLAAGRRVVHLATHGFFLGGVCLSALDEAGRGEFARGADAAFGRARGENPLLLSGLALAGANHREAAGPDEEDGILTAEEIASLDLSGVGWAVLSGCETGVGRVQAGEGVLGLRRAFSIAGARTMIMSLWRVDDQAAREWMGNLYEARLSGFSTAEAVREASRHMLRARRRAGENTHPFSWGAFVASGDWK